MSRSPHGRSAARVFAGLAALALGGGCATPEGYEAAAAEARRNADFPGNRLYEDRMERHFRLPLERAARSCALAHPDARGVRILSRLAADGAVEEVILFPDAPFGHCVRGKIAEEEFAAPPEPDYWISLEVPGEGAGAGR